MKDPLVVVDASFLLKLLLPEESSDRVAKQWESWIENSVEVIAPTLIIFEVSSVLRNKVFRGILDKSDAFEMLNRVEHLDITLMYSGELLELAWETGSVLKAAALYDCFYLALAKLLGTSFWTSDKRVYRSVRKEFSFINLL